MTEPFNSAVLAALESAMRARNPNHPDLTFRFYPCDVSTAAPWAPPGQRPQAPRVRPTPTTALLLDQHGHVIDATENPVCLAEDGRWWIELQPRPEPAPEPAPEP